MEIDFKIKANDARKEILTLIHKAQTSHIASNFSVIDIATVLYNTVKKHDEVVWSKGWAAATIYYFLWKQGKITRKQLESFPNEPFLGLAETTVPGVHVAGGSVGHGLPVAIGMALAKKRANECGSIYCIMSDGELNEGTTWESAALASHHKLNNLVAIIDVNKWQAMGKTSDVIDYEPLEKKFEAFGWNVCRVNGHNYFEIKRALFMATLFLSDRPHVIIADTVKGSGGSTACDIFEQGLLYHYKHIDKEVYEKAMELLDRERM